MSTATQSPPVTPAELERMPDSVRFELVDGQLEERNMGSESSWIAGEIHAIIRNYARQHQSGRAWPADQAYRCFDDDPDRVRKPDVSFIRAGRLEGDYPSSGYETIPPDLAVEVLSPNDQIDNVERKIDEYLDAGVSLVWVVNPDLRRVTVYRNDGTVERIAEDGHVSGEGVIAGFECPTSDFFPKPIGTSEQA